MRGFPVKAIRMLYVVALLALCLVLGCSSNPATPASSTENAASGATGGGNAASGAAGSKRQTGKPAASKPVKQTITIPAGTQITVRLGETLSSKSSSAGQGFSATVAEPVVVDGKTVIEKGAAARGTVVDAKAMGHFKGGALLEVRLELRYHRWQRYIGGYRHGGALGRGQRQALGRIHRRWRRSRSTDWRIGRRRQRSGHRRVGWRRRRHGRSGIYRQQRYYSAGGDCLELQTQAAGVKFAEQFSELD